MFKHVFISLLVVACIYAFWRGRSDERVAASACLLATVCTVLFAAPYPVRYSRVENGELIIDVLLLAVFVATALRSMRFWPLWVAGLQLTITISHVLKAIEPDLVPQVYAVAERMWSYPILIILIIGTWRGTRREPDSLGLPS